jgi:hypothetical protein
LLLQQELSEVSARLQQQLLTSEQNAGSKACRILALEDALTGKWRYVFITIVILTFFISAARSHFGSPDYNTDSSEQIVQFE